MGQAPPAFSHASRGRLTAYDLDRFPGQTLFDRLGRAVCNAGCLPRKELYEAWEVARRVRRRFRGGRVIDLACGHGRHARFLAVRGHPVLAGDRDAAALATLAGVTGIETQVADLEQGIWPLGRQRFDAIVVTHYPVSYTHLLAHETVLDLVCRLLLEKKQQKHKKKKEKTKKKQIIIQTYLRPIITLT